MELLNHTDKFPENKKIIVNRNLEMHMEQAQCDQAKRNITIENGLTKHEQSLEIVITMIIHTRNEHLNMQANKLNAKYHLHVQHSTDTKTLR